MLKFVEEGEEEQKNSGKDVHRRLDFGEAAMASAERHESHDRIKQLAKEQTLQAERYKADLEPPKGKDQFTDDLFFHVFCHVEDNVVEKVEDRKFVDFDK